MARVLAGAATGEDFGRWVGQGAGLRVGGRPSGGLPERRVGGFQAAGGKPPPCKRPVPRTGLGAEGRLNFLSADYNGLVILTHGAVKRTQTTATTDLDRAKRVRDAYLSAKAMGWITRQDWRSDG